MKKKHKLPVASVKQSINLHTFPVTSMKKNHKFPVTSMNISINFHKFPVTSMNISINFHKFPVTSMNISINFHKFPVTSMNISINFHKFPVTSMNKSASSRHSVHIAAIVRREAQIPGHLEVHQLGSHHLGPSIRWSRNVVWNMTSPFLIGKPSIFMGHLYHGYVSHNQRVCIYIYSCIISGRFPAWMHSARYYCLHDDLGIYTVNIYIYIIFIGCEWTVSLQNM